MLSSCRTVSFPAVNGYAVGTTYRKKNGSVIVEGAAVAVMLTGLIVGLLLLFLNTVVAGGYDYKLRIVAAEAAKQIDAEQFWLGMPRDDYHQDVAQTDAQKLADSLLDSLGMPHTSSFTAKTTMANINGRQVPITRVDLTVSGLKTVNAPFVPPFFSLSATGISSANAYPPYATCVLTLRNPDDYNNSRAVEVPAYAAYLLRNGAYQVNGTKYANNKFGFTGSTARVFVNVQENPGAGAVGARPVIEVGEVGKFGTDLPYGP